MFVKGSNWVAVNREGCTTEIVAVAGFVRAHKTNILSVFKTITPELHYNIPGTWSHVTE